MRRTVALLSIAVLCGTAATAAGAPIKLANAGDDPWVFVDRQGTTHVAWDVTTASVTRTFYRRAVAGSRTFSPAVELPISAVGEDFSGVYITQDPAPSDRLVVITERAPTVTGQPGTFAVTSTDGGVTWSAGVAVADPAPSVNLGDGRANLVANGPAGIWAVNGNPSTRVIKIPSALTPLVRSTDQVAISPQPYYGQVAFDGAGTPIFAFGSLEQGFLRVGETGADQLIYTSARIASIHLASGPRGTAVLWSGGPLTRQALRVRRLVGGVLTPDVQISPAGDTTVAVPYMSADQTGRYHAVWRGNGGDLVYRRSETGATWGPVTILVRGNATSSPHNPVVSAGPDGRGWAVYTSGINATPVLIAPLDTATSDPAVPDLSGIDNPQVRRRGSSIFVTPRNPSLAKLRRGRCVNVRVQSTKPASIRVAIFSGRRSIRVFGATVVRFAKPGKRVVCVRVPLRAKTFDVRQPFRFAFAVREGAPGRPSTKPATLTTTGFTFFK